MASSFVLQRSRVQIPAQRSAILTEVSEVLSVTLDILPDSNSIEATAVWYKVYTIHY
jgi:hypothetical protein